MKRKDIMATLVSDKADLRTRNLTSDRGTLHNDKDQFIKKTQQC